MEGGQCNGAYVWVGGWIGGWVSIEMGPASKACGVLTHMGGWVDEWVGG